MGQTHSRPSTPVKWEPGASENLAGTLQRSQILPDQLAYLEGEPVYHPHTSNTKNVDSMFRKIATKAFFCRPPGGPLTLRHVKFLNHQPAHLALAIRRYIQPQESQLTNIQKTAIKKWNKLDILNCTDQSRFVPTQDILEKYFHIFDNLFFGGTLEKNVTIVASEVSNMEAGNRGIACQHYDMTHNCYIPQSTITIYDHQDPNLRDRIEVIMSTLIHEMCHAFFQVYGCVSNCCDNGSLELGPRGHGIMFQEMAYDIERMAASKRVLGFDLDLGRYISLLTEISDKADWKEQMNVSRWGFDEEKMANDLIICKTQGIHYVLS